MAIQKQGTAFSFQCCFSPQEALKVNLRYHERESSALGEDPRHLLANDAILPCIS